MSIILYNVWGYYQYWVSYQLWWVSSPSISQWSCNFSWLNEMSCICLSSSKSNFLKINTYKYETLKMGLFLDVRLILSTLGFSSLRNKIREEESETLFEHFIKYQWQMFTLRSWLAKYYFMRSWNCELIRSSCKTMLTFNWLLAIIILVDDIQKMTDCKKKLTHLLIIKDVSYYSVVTDWLQRCKNKQHRNLLIQFHIHAEL